MRRLRKAEDAVVAESSVDDQVRIAASDYQLQMQAYALAVRELVPSLLRMVRRSFPRFIFSSLTSSFI